jgi:hypothetical protein
VHGLKEAMKALARERPYLLKTEDASDKDKDDKKPKKKTGDKPGDKGDEASEAEKKAALHKKYPGLKRR